MVGIGINIPLVGFGVALGSAQMVAVAFMSGTLCYLGYRFKVDENADDTLEHRCGIFQNISRSLRIFIPKNMC